MSFKKLAEDNEALGKESKDVKYGTPEVALKHIVNNFREAISHLNWKKKKYLKDGKIKKATEMDDKVRKLQTMLDDAKTEVKNKKGIK